MLDQPALEKRLCLTAQGRFPGRTGLEWLRLALAGSVTAVGEEGRHETPIPPPTPPRWRRAAATGPARYGQGRTVRHAGGGVEHLSFARPCSPAPRSRD